MPGLDELASLLGMQAPDKKDDTRKRGYDGTVQRVRVRTEKRRGASITIAWGFQSTPDELKRLLSICRKKIGTGGVVADNQLEIQGDHVARVGEILTEEGYKVGK